MPKVVDTVGVVDKIETNVGLTKDKPCPYRKTVAETVIPLSMFEERFDFQIEESGKIGRISLGTFDLVKEVNSHNGEVGLINILRLAEARGLDPMTFAKTEPGIMVDMSGIETVDDLIKAQANADAKLNEFAQTLGITVEELIKAVQNGTVADLKKPEVEDKQGGANDGTNA